MTLAVLFHELTGVSGGEKLTASQLTGIKKKALDSFTILSHINTNIVRTRKDDILFSLGKEFRQFRTDKKQDGVENLFSDETVKQIKSLLKKKAPAANTNWQRNAGNRNSSQPRRGRGNYNGPKNFGPFPKQVPSGKNQQKGPWNQRK